MSEQRILIYHEQLADRYEEILKSQGVRGVFKASNVVEAKPIIAECQVLFGWRVPQELLRQARHLRWIQAMGAGVDDLLAMESLSSDVMITRIVGQFGEPIAEYTFAHLLYVFKNLQRSLKAQSEATWAPFIPGNLAGKSIGVAGIGSIGCQVAKISKAFNMHVLGLSRSERNCSFVDEHFYLQDFVVMASKCDVLVLTLPLTAETYHIVNRDLLGVMKSDAWIVNVGRGRLIDEQALVEHLHEGKLGGVILDVFEQEPLPLDHPLWHMPNAFVTPHLSGPSDVQSVADFFVRNLQRFLAGEELLGQVDRVAGY